MEQRRVLLIIASVTIVLAAIVGVGIWLFYPREAAEPGEIADASGGLEWEPLDYLRGDGGVPGIEPDAETAAEPGAESGLASTEDDDEFVVTYGVAEDEGQQGANGVPSSPLVTEAPPTRDATASAASASAAADSAGATATRTAPPANTATGSAGSVSRTTAAASASGTSTTTTSTTTAARTAAEPARTAGSVSTETTSRSTATPSVEQELADRAYWVQAISSPNRDTIEQAQRTLREHQLGSRILTKEIGGTMYYRLRLGPFAVREEAEKFLGWVTDINDFADAMIFVDYTTAVLAANQ